MIVTVAVPVAALLVAASVSVLVVVAEAGLNVAVTPLGRPDAARPTLPVKLFCGVTATVLVPVVPWVMLTLVGDADRLKLGGGALTVTLTVAV